MRAVVLVGCGHSHVAVLRSFGIKPMPGVRLTVITRETQTPYSGMLPGFVAGHYGFDDVHIDAARLSRFAGAQFYHDEVIGFDLEERKVLCRNRPPVAFDILSINIGSTPSIAVVPGARENAVSVKPIDTFISRWEKAMRRVLDRRGDARIGVVGGGAGGVELILAIQYRLNALLAEAGLSNDRLRFTLVTSSATLLPSFTPRVQRKFATVLRERRIGVVTGQAVSSVSDGILHVETAPDIVLDEIFWVTEASGAPWLKGAGLALDEGGFIRVDATLRAVSHERIFAAGDIAAMDDQPRPKSGVFAVRQGSILAENVRRAITGESLKPYIAQKHMLSLISTGDKYAVAARGRWYGEGRWAWLWKDWIDRRFMRRYNDLPLTVQ